MSTKESKGKQKRMAHSCPVCGKGHAGECIGKDRCFACGEEGHYRKQCPALNESGSQTKEIKRQAPYKKCERKHRKDYKERIDVCYKCGQPGHYRKDCPQNQEGLGKPDEGKEEEK